MSQQKEYKDLGSCRIGGVSLFSTVDWPGHITSTVFLKGCPWRCPYCHNKHLLSGAAQNEDLLWEQVFEELTRRKGFLDGIVFSGGEPLVSTRLREFMSAVKAQGFLVGLHTNGTNPERLASLLASTADSECALLDWVGLDMKAPYAAYDELTAVARSAQAVRASLLALQSSGVNYELRTTLYPDAFDDAAILALGEELLALGEKSWVWQKYREEDSFRERLPLFEIESMRERLMQEGFEQITIR